VRGTGHNHVEKTLPQPQQQPNKTKTTTQHQKQPNIKPSKNLHIQKNPQQLNKNTETKVSKSKTGCFIFCKFNCFSSIGQKLANQEFPAITGKL